METVQTMSFEVCLKFTALFSLLLLNLLAWTTGKGEYVLNIFILLRKTEENTKKKKSAPTVKSIALFYVHQRSISTIMVQMSKKIGAHRGCFCP